MRSLTIPVLFLALLVLPAQTALADVPAPFEWIVPSHVTLVGLGPAGPDSALGQVTCLIRDLAQNPVPGATVDFDFSNGTDLVLAIDQHDPRLSTDCSRRTASAVTDENGIARFTIMGSGKAGPVHAPKALRIYADGILGGYASVAVLERDGVGGLTLADLAYWTTDLFSSTNPERSDFNGSGYVDIADLSLWAAAYFSGNNALPAGPYCP